MDGTFKPATWQGMKKQPLPSASKFTLLRQLCNRIPGHLVPKLPRETGVDKACRTFSAGIHVVAMLSEQLNHSISLNDVRAALRLHSGHARRLVERRRRAATGFLMPARHARPFLPRSSSGRCSGTFSRSRRDLHMDAGGGACPTVSARRSTLWIPRPSSWWPRAWTGPNIADARPQPSAI